jgi:hypothetical protein
MTAAHRDHGTPTFDINFTFTEFENGVELVIDYRTELFTKDGIESLMKKYLQLLYTCVREEQRMIKELVIG